MNVEYRTSSESSLTEVFIDGEWRGSFMSQRKAKFFVEGLSKDVKVIDERSGVVSQKNDEVKPKRRGRPRKADNDWRKLPSVRSTGS